MEVNELRGWITLATLLAYAGVCWLAYDSRNRRRFERDALLPFADERERSARAQGDRER
jgi:cytochrome c oxidase cbb3-type subunit 4